MKFFKSSLRFSVLMVILILISLPDYCCKQSSGAISEDYYPLEEGMRWVYQVALVDRSGNIIGSEKMFIENLPVEELEKEKVTPQKREMFGQSFFAFILKNDKGICMFAVQSPDSVKPEITGCSSNSNYSIMNPVQVGITWNSSTVSILLKREVSLNLKNTIESIDETVIVPAGIFKKCLKIKSRGTIKKELGFMGTADITIETYVWYASGIGLIKSVHNEKNIHWPTIDSGQITMQLESFKK